MILSKTYWNINFKYVPTTFFILSFPWRQGEVNDDGVVDDDNDDDDVPVNINECMFFNRNCMH